MADCVIYVTVEPCLMCAAALGWAQIGGVVFGAADPKRGYLNYYGRKAPQMPTPLHPRTQVIGGVLEAECGALMQEFFQNKRR